MNKYLRQLFTAVVALFVILGGEKLTKIFVHTRSEEAHV